MRFMAMVRMLTAWQIAMNLRSSHLRINSTIEAHASLLLRGISRCVISFQSLTKILLSEDDARYCIDHGRCRTILRAMIP